MNSRLFFDDSADNDERLVDGDGDGDGEECKKDENYTGF